MLRPIIISLVLFSAALATIVANLSPSPSPSRLIQSTSLPHTMTGRASVIDGDTIEMQGTRVRLFGIDAPESDQICTDNGRSVRCGQEAAMALSNRIGGRTVECNRKDIDLYGRIVATCATAGEDVGAWMVTRGWALAYRYYSTDYVSQEQTASEAKVGLWRGDFERPWDWRHKHAQQIKAGQVPGVANGRQFLQSADAIARPDNCMIKGNISGQGHVYHMPGDKYYGPTVINTAKGERWFCSEAEAQAAGWRRSRQ